MVTSAEHEASEGQNVGQRPVTAVVTSEAGAHSKRDRKSLRGFSAGELYDLMNIFQTAFRTLRGGHCRGRRSESSAPFPWGARGRDGDQRGSSEHAGGRAARAWRGSALQGEGRVGAARGPGGGT